MPFVAYGVYKLISGRATLTSPRRVVGAFVAGYIGINAAALATAIELGIQPDLFHDASGAPLYSPYHLGQTIPAMLLAHLVVAGIAEGILSAAVVAYLQRANLPLLQVNHPGVPVDDAAAAAAQDRRRRLRPGVVAMVAVGIMVVLTPLGLLAPGGAFGEDSPDDLTSNLGLSGVPAGMTRYADFWQNAIFPDYLSDSPWTYIVSAIVGIVVVGLVVYGLGLLVARVFGRQEPASTTGAEQDREESSRP
jgi:cobalt/nickel transport system permease protein